MNQRTITFYQGRLALLGQEREVVERRRHEVVSSIQRIERLREGVQQIEAPGDRVDALTRWLEQNRALDDELARRIQQFQIAEQALRAEMGYVGESERA